jgi:predicted HTH transcriptional regulator
MVLAHYDMNDIDQETLKHYRTMFRVKNPDHVWNQHDDKTFLTDLGGYRKDREYGIEGLTLAGLLMFGKGLAIREKLSNIMMAHGRIIFLISS